MPFIKKTLYNNKGAKEATENKHLIFHWQVALREFRLNLKAATAPPGSKTDSK